MVDVIIVTILILLCILISISSDANYELTKIKQQLDEINEKLYEQEDDLK